MLAPASIRFRLTAWYAVSLAVLLGLLATASYFAMRASIYRAVDVDLRYRLASVEDELHESAGDLPVRQLAEDIARNSGLDVLFEMFDGSGKMIYQSDQLAGHHISPPAPSPADSAVVFRDISDQWPVRLAAQKISFRGEPLIVEVAEPLRFHYASLRDFSISLLVAIPLIVVIAAAVGYWLGGRALAPVNQIVAEARAIDPNRLSRRLSLPPARDELHRLTETLNSMLDRIEGSVSRIRQFTADASHELRAPLTLIQAAAEYSLRRERSHADLLDAMQTILRETTRTSHLVDDLLLLARADSDQDTFPADPVELNSLLGEAVDRARQLANDATVNISTNIGEAPVIVSGDAGLLQRLFLILIDNALKYTPQNGSVTVSLDANGNHATVAVVDTGIGIAPADLPHIFDRFWRADKVRSRDVGGTGLGLSIARWIVARNGGTLHVESVLGKGSRFEVRLPRLQTGSQN